MTMLKTVDEFYEQVAKDLAIGQASKLGLDDLKESLALAAAHSGEFINRAFALIVEMQGFEVTEDDRGEFENAMEEKISECFQNYLDEWIDTHDF